jgi:hypothetical protein
MAAGILGETVDAGMRGIFGLLADLTGNADPQIGMAACHTPPFARDSQSHAKQKILSLSLLPSHISHSQLSTPITNCQLSIINCPFLLLTLHISRLTFILEGKDCIKAEAASMY